MTTNYIVHLCGTTWEQRYILPPFRDGMHKLEDRMAELGYEPLLVVGKHDLRWWEDDLEFIFFCMIVGDFGWDKMKEFCDDIINRPLTEGEVRTFTNGDCTISVRADDDPLTDGIMTNNCEPIEEEMV